MLAVHGEERGAVCEYAWERGSWLATVGKSMQRSLLVKEGAGQPVE